MTTEPSDSPNKNKVLNNLITTSHLSYLPAYDNAIVTVIRSRIHFC